MKHFSETLVGVFLIIGLLCFSFIAVQLGGWSPVPTKAISVYARFDNISGLKSGSSVEIAGVRVGTVGTIILENDQAKIELKVLPGLTLPSDSVASIRTRGIIGEKFVKLLPGALEDKVANGEELDETESVIDIEELIGKFIYKDK